MARLWSSGFELNSAALLEFSTATGSAISVQSAIVRSGSYAARINGLTSGAQSRIGCQFSSSASSGPIYARVYFLYTTLPSAANRIIFLGSTTTTADAYITLDNSGQLTLFDEDGQIGSPSSALSANTWYRIEMMVDFTGAGATDVITARIDGVNFASGTTSTITTDTTAFVVGGNHASEAQTVGDWYFDDIAINDNTGSFQNSWPGEGKIIHLKPNAAGDINTFTTQTGGTAGAANNFTRVNETTPNDATSFNGSTTLNEEDLFNVDASGIGPSDTISLVAVGGRFRNSVADATGAFRFELEKTSGGTILQSSAIVPNSTTWRTNITGGTLRTYPITAYQDPDTSNWTRATLDSMQIGYKYTVDGANRIDVTAVWALVEYIPVADTNIVGFATTPVAASADASVTFDSSYTPLEDDLILIFPSSQSTLALAADPSGWVNPLGSAVEVNADSFGASVGYHWVTSGEESAVTRTFTATNWFGGAETGEVHAVAIRGIDTTDPIDGINTTFDNTDTVTPHLTAAITGAGTIEDGSIVIANVTKDSVGVYGGPPAGWWSLLKTSNNQGKWTGARHDLTTANTDVTAASITPSAGDEYIGITVALKLASGGGDLAVNVSDSVTVSESVNRMAQNYIALVAPQALTVSASATETTGSNVDGTSYTTGAFTPTANKLQLLWVYSIAAAAPNTPTVTGAGLTWQEIDNQIDSNGLRKITLFRAMGSSPSNGALTIDFSGQTQTGAAWSWVEYTNADTSGSNGSGAIVQAVKNASAGNDTSLTVTLAAFASAANATAGGFGIPLNTAATPVAGSGFTATGQRNQSTPNLSIGSEFLASNDTSVDMTSGAASIPWVGIAVEIKPIIQGGADTITVTESLALTTALNISVSDTTTVTESVQRLAENRVAVSDSATIAESVSLYRDPLLASVSDNSTLSEEIKLEVGSYISKSDSTTVSEALQRLVEGRVAVSDSLTVTEAVQRHTENRIAVSDTITATEAISLLIPELFLNVSDNATVTESVTASVSASGFYVVNVSDSVTLTESTTLDELVTVSRADSVTVSESTSIDVNQATPREVTVSDSVTITESLQNTGSTSLSTTDSVTITEGVDRTVENRVAVADTIAITESVGVSIQATATPTISVSDEVTVTEFRFVSVEGVVNPRKYYIDTKGDIYWIISESIGLVEKI